MLVRAARLYYLEGKSQAEVAEQIGVTRSNVSRVLTEARRLGIVEIRVHDRSGRDEALEARLSAAFGLRDCRVAPSGGGTGTSLQRVGALAAEWLTESMPRRGAIGLSWGSAVQALADALPEGGQYPDVQVLPLVGGLSIVDSARDANMIIQTVAQKLGAASQRLLAPAVVESAATRDAMLREPSIRSVLDAGRAASLAIVGVGTVGFGASSEIVDSMHLDAEAFAAFLASGAVGDCCTRFFDESGGPVLSAVDDRVVAIDLEALRAIPTVVGVAAGARKSAGMRGALRGGLIDVAMVDSDLAEALLG